MTRSWTRPGGLYAPGQDTLEYTLLGNAWWIIRLNRRFRVTGIARVECS